MCREAPSDATGLVLDELAVLTGEGSRAADLVDAAAAICAAMAPCWLPPSADAFVTRSLTAWLSQRCTEARPAIAPPSPLLGHPATASP